MKLINYSISDIAEPVALNIMKCLCVCSDDLEEGGDIEVNYLEVEESSPYLKFNKEVSRGRRR